MSSKFQLTRLLCKHIAAASGEGVRVLFTENMTHSTTG